MTSTDQTIPPSETPTPTPTQPVTQRQRAFRCLCFLGAGAALAATALPLKLPFTVCAFRAATGLPCPGCGMTRAFCALAQGRIHDAAAFNLASIPLALLVAVATILLLLEVTKNKPYLSPAFKKSKSLIYWIAPSMLLFAWAVNLAKAFSYIPAHHLLTSTF
jgi:hypothetical protein